MPRNSNDEVIILEGTNLLQIKGDASNQSIKTSLAANGSSNVTISNVAPAGVGTATISKWLAIQDESGVVYYIPCWT